MNTKIFPSWTSCESEFTGKHARQNARAKAKKMIKKYIAELTEAPTTPVWVTVFNAETFKTLLYFQYTDGEICEYEGALEEEPETEETSNARTEAEEFVATLTDEQVHRIVPKVKAIAEEFGVDTSEFEETAEVSDESVSPDTIAIEIPFTSCGDLTKEKETLRDLINSKATLIKAALGEDGTGELPIKFADGKARFEWLRCGTDGNSDAVRAWSAFLSAAVKFARKGKKVTAKDAAVENEKFAFRTYLVKIGLNGAEDKWTRKFLLRNLQGDSAFATPESKQKWLAKHGSKFKNTEVNENENAE